MSYAIKSQAVYDLIEIDLYKVPYLRAPHSWYANIQKNEKPYLHAITLLADTVSFYMPIIERNEDGTVGAVQQRFAGEFLQRNYKQIQEQYGLTRKQARPAYQHLEEAGLLKVHFDTVQTNRGKILSNVMYIQLFPHEVARVTLGSIDLNGWMAAAIKPSSLNGHTGKEPLYPNGNDGISPVYPFGNTDEIPSYPNGHSGENEPSSPNGHDGDEVAVLEGIGSQDEKDKTDVPIWRPPVCPNGHDPSLPFGHDPSCPNGNDHCTNILSTNTLGTKILGTAAAAAAGDTLLVQEKRSEHNSTSRARYEEPVSSDPPFTDPIWWNLANEWVSRSDTERLCQEYMSLDDWRDQDDIISGSDTGQLFNLLLWLHYAQWNGANMTENGIQNLPGYIRARLDERPPSYSKQDIEHLLVQIRKRTDPTSKI